MKIAVNARFLLPGLREGFGRFSHEVLRRMVKSHPEDEFHFFFDRPYQEEYLYAQNVIPHVLIPQARHPLLYIAFFEVTVPLMLARTKADIFFSPDGFLSLMTGVPQVNVMHDLSFELPDPDMGKLYSKYYRYFFPKFAKKSSQIITVSQYSKSDIITRYGINENKVSVALNGASDAFTVEGEKHVESHPYFLYAGAIQPRKNLSGLLQAFDLFKGRTGLPHLLVLTGRKAWNFEDIIKTYGSMRYKKDVVFTGFVSEEKLAALYRGATALCYVSFFEGFGLPILEAMNCGTAVIVSETSSMPEVCGPAGYFIDPGNPESIAAKMQKVVEDPQLRQNNIAVGLKFKEQFSWDKTTEICWNALKNAHQIVNQ